MIQNAIQHCHEKDLRVCHLGNFMDDLLLHRLQRTAQQMGLILKVVVKGSAVDHGLLAKVCHTDIVKRLLLHQLK